MTFNIITNISNGLGLQRDAELLKALLESAGHTADLTGIVKPRPWEIDPLVSPRSHDVNIFLEVICSPIPPANENWFIPNSEWYEPPYEAGLCHIDRVLCKTKDCLTIWRKKVGNKAEYVGFESRDFFRPEVIRERKFLHLLGNSTSKNTEAVLGAWPLPYPLIVVSHGKETAHFRRSIPNVTYLDRVSDESLSKILNGCQFHIMPSQYEGYGQVLHEGISCGAVVITTDAAPMNEPLGIDRSLLIPVARTEPWRLAYRNFVSSEGVTAAVHNAARMTLEQLAEQRRFAREGFLKDRENFRKAFLGLV